MQTGRLTELVGGGTADVTNEGLGHGCPPKNLGSAVTTASPSVPPGTLPGQPWVGSEQWVADRNRATDGRRGDAVGCGVHHDDGHHRGPSARLDRRGVPTHDRIAGLDLV